MLTVEIKGNERLLEGCAEVEIYCDREGLEELRRQIDILDRGGTHVHLMSEAWAGNELTEQKQGSETVLAHHLLIVCKQPF